MKKCPKCGKTYDDSWKICLSCCNAKLTDDLSVIPTGAEPFEFKLSRKRQIIFGIFLMLLGVFFSFTYSYFETDSIMGKLGILVMIIWPTYVGFSLLFPNVALKIQEVGEGILKAMGILVVAVLGIIVFGFLGYAIMAAPGVPIWVKVIILLGAIKIIMNDWYIRNLQDKISALEARLDDIDEEVREQPSGVDEFSEITLRKE